MKSFFLFLLTCAYLNNYAQIAPAQNSLLANFGSSTCANASAPSLSLMGSPLSGSTLLSNCNLSTIMPNFYSVFVAYNPKDNNLYLADVRSTPTKVWIVNEGLPNNISCPTLSATPTYTYSASGFVPNNFEFDANGDVWSLRSYNNATGQCIMDKFDEATGNVLFTKTLQFPAGNYPNNISSGDLTILPNGKMYATFGDAPSKLFEITNYASGASNASATFLKDLPLPCYGIAYLNGQLEVTGTNLTNSCYYFDYDIASNTLGAQTTFQNGQAPIDNASITASIGSTKRLLNQTVVNANTADLTYEIHARNLGNVALTLANITDDLGAIYGAANVSNVTTSFASGGNPAGLSLNTSYNGTTVTTLLNAGQVLPNQTPGNSNYFVTILVSCRVTNLNTSTIYKNTAIATGSIGSGATQINVADSSNNGSSSAIDLNNDGNAASSGENVTTPFNFGIILPVKFLNVNATLISNNAAKISWSVATPTNNVNSFEVERSIDGVIWNKIGSVQFTSNSQSTYNFTDNNFTTDKAFYRVKQIDVDGKFVYSTIMFVKKNNNKEKVSIFPTPANNVVNVVTESTNNVQLDITDLQGRKVKKQIINGNFTQINTTDFSNGVYLFTVNNATEKTTIKVSILH